MTDTARHSLRVAVLGCGVASRLTLTLELTTLGGRSLDIIFVARKRDVEDGLYAAARAILRELVTLSED